MPNVGAHLYIFILQLQVKTYFQMFHTHKSSINSSNIKVCVCKLRFLSFNLHIQVTLETFNSMGICNIKHFESLFFN